MVSLFKIWADSNGFVLEFLKFSCSIVVGRCPYVIAIVIYKNSLDYFSVLNKLYTYINIYTFRTALFKNTFFSYKFEVWVANAFVTS